VEPVLIAAMVVAIAEIGDQTHLLAIFLASPCGAAAKPAAHGHSPG